MIFFLWFLEIAFEIFIKYSLKSLKWHKWDTIDRPDEPTHGETDLSRENIILVEDIRMEFQIGMLQ